MLYICIHLYKDRVLTLQNTNIFYVRVILHALPQLLLISISFITSLRPHCTRLSIRGTS